jgi:site-specific DNA-adenine methylase
MVSTIITWVVFLIGFLLLFYLNEKLYKAVFASAAATDILFGKNKQKVEELENRIKELEKLLENTKVSCDDFCKTIYDSYDE